MDDFITVTPPIGGCHQLSISTSDSYHAAVAAAAHDANWFFLNAWLRPGDVFFDLGANIGTISVPAAKLGAAVHAFELLQENIRHLNRSAQQNGLAIAVEMAAVSDRNGSIGFGGHSAWGQVVAGGTDLVRSIAIDSYVVEHGVASVTAMKIDVEGSELAALRGASGLIGRDHPDIVIECNAITCGNTGYSYRDLLSTLADQGYTLYRLHRNRLCPWRAAMVQEVIYTDYLATTRTAEAVSQRSGWPIAELTDDEIVESIVEQDRYGALHQQFVLAIGQTLPDRIRADERVAALMARWADNPADPGMLAVLQAGAA